MRRGILIANLTAGRLEKEKLLETVVSRARDRGVNLDVKVTEYAGHASVLAGEARRDRIDLVAVFGGDGSIREVGGELSGSSLPLYILPAGTSNVLARSLGIPLDPVEAAGLFERETFVSLDSGMANHHEFFFMCGAGIDAEVMASVSIPLKKKLGRVSFYPAVIRQFLTYRMPHLSITVDGRPFKAVYAAVTNIPHYAGPYILCPPARYDDGLLDVVLFHDASRLNLIKKFWKIKRCTLLSDPNVTHLTGREILISAQEPVRYQLDGDCAGVLPVTVRARSGSLKVAV